MPQDWSFLKRLFEEYREFCSLTTLILGLGLVGIWAVALFGLGCSGGAVLFFMMGLLVLIAFKAIALFNRDGYGLLFGLGKMLIILLFPVLWIASWWRTTKKSEDLYDEHEIVFGCLAVCWLLGIVLGYFPYYQHTDYAIFQMISCAPIGMFIVLSIVTSLVASATRSQTLKKIGMLVGVAMNILAPWHWPRGARALWHLVTSQD